MTRPASMACCRAWLLSALLGLTAAALADPATPSATPADTAANVDAKPTPDATAEIPLENPAPAPVDAPTGHGVDTAPTTFRRVQAGCSLRDYGAPVERGQLASAVVNTCAGFSLHRPMFLMPFTYSPRFPGNESEVIFQISGKAQLWDYDRGQLYFGYTQKSFFEAFNEKHSKPFRETDFNPEIFTRLPHPLAALPDWSLDVGLEHESNGEDLPGSRSWNRLYLQPYWVRGREVWQLKVWWRLPENSNRPATDPARDDNPDIGAYYGYGELHYRRDFSWRNALLDVMLRANPGTGRGAIQADYSVEVGRVGALFVRVFNGYGESLIDYNRSVTRIGVGIALQR